MRKRIFLVIFWGIIITYSFGETNLRRDYSEKLQQIRSIANDPKFAVDPSSTIVFPQVANGVVEGIRIVTSIVLTSNEGDPFSVTLEFTQSDGAQMEVALWKSDRGNLLLGQHLGVGSKFSVTIQPFESVFLQTDGVGKLSVGWAKATAEASSLMGGFAAYQLIQEATNQLLTIVGVGASAGAPSFFMPIFRGTSLHSNTAIALANSSNSTAYLQVFLIENGGGIEERTISIGPRQQSARFIDEIFPSVGSRFFGTLYCFRVDSSSNVDIQFDIHPVVLFLSNGILSPIPVTNMLSP
ncbi:hypothetical protein MYX65_12795 [Acidobacteria bacterium AH-259-L09]|nr:hypothetical protein [Acidobacteria bacterium AH-259-L09]